MSSIISAPALLRERKTGSAPILLDIRWQLGGPPGKPAYLAGHLPGAAYVDMETDLAGPVSAGTGRHPLPPATAFAEAMRRAGVRADRPVVVYDGGQGIAAARAWWLLRTSGHPDVRVLDGGLPAWEGPLETGDVAPARGDFEPSPDTARLLDADGAASLARRGLLLDARAAARYRGEAEPVDPVAGHIPGAVSGDTAENTREDGTFRSPEELRARFEALGAAPSTEIGVYCGSGVSAAHQLLALTLAGFDSARLYAGSWSEWITDPSRPVATGPEPG